MKNLAFAPGDFAVYPTHGVGRITGVETQRIFGSEIEVFVVTKWVEFNLKYSETWPNITRLGEPPEDADEWREVSDKMQHFSPNPGSSGGS